MTDLIKRDDALALCDRYPYVEGVKSALEDLSAVAVGVKSLRYFEPKGSTVEQMRDHARQHPLAKEGDMKLVWINEGDLSIYLLAALTSPDALLAELEKTS